MFICRAMKPAIPAFRCRNISIGLDRLDKAWHDGTPSAGLKIADAVEEARGMTLTYRL